jgi:hypothetical protein
MQQMSAGTSSRFYDFPSDGYLVLSLITPLEAFQEGIARLMERLHPR